MCKRIFFVSLSAMRRWMFFILVSILTMECTEARTRMDSVLINRVFNYRQTIEFNQFPDEMSYYTRFYIKKSKRNPILWAVPSMYRIARHSEREFAGETWNKFKPYAKEKNFTQVSIRRYRGEL